jgi:hypothetical protein
MRPAMTGETLKGRSINVSSVPLPGKRYLAMSQQAATPNATLIGTEMAAVSRVSRIAEIVSGSEIACQ